MNNDLRTQFLAEYASELGKINRPELVERETLEAASHLDELIRSHMELGDTLEEATQNAISQFGRSRELGRELATAISSPFPAGRWVALSAFSAAISYVLLLQLGKLGIEAGAASLAGHLNAITYSVIVTAILSSLMVWGRDPSRHNKLTVVGCTIGFFAVALPALLALPNELEEVVAHSISIGFKMVPMVVLILVMVLFMPMSRSRNRQANLP